MCAVILLQWDFITEDVTADWCVESEDMDVVVSRSTRK